MKKINWYNMIHIFLIASVLGWVIENTFNLIRTGELVNPSALVIGPIDMAYGIGACVLTILLIEFKNCSYIKLFIIGFIGGSVLEYIMSLGMELFLGFTVWDYSKYAFNINGRICLLFSVFWGILGIIWIKVCYPFLNEIIERISSKTKKTIAIIIVVFLLLDIFLTLSSVNRAHENDRGIPPRNSYEEFLDKTFNTEYLKKMYSNNWK